MIKVDGIWEWTTQPTTGRRTGYEDVIDSFNIISVEDYKGLNEADQYVMALIVLDKIRRVNIYPTYYYSDKEIERTIVKCMSVSTPELITYNTTGNTLLEYLFPNMHRVDAGNSINNCLYNRFYDDDKLMKCIMRHMKNYRFTNLRTMFFMYGRYFWQTATGFSPMRAKAICTQLTSAGDTVYDFSAGFGGRMLGSLSAKRRYIGCEPDTNTFYNLQRLGAYINNVNSAAEYSIINKGSEDMRMASNSVDLVFSCPPYFALERYSQECTQSIVRFPRYTEWLEGYVRPTLTTAFKALKPGKSMALVLATRIYYMNKPYPLGDDWKRIAEQVGFKFIDTLCINKRSRKLSSNSEQLYLFKKGV